MNLACQELVNAQVEVNRAVFEANKTQSDTRYLQVCIAEAMQDLAAANKVLLGIRRLPSNSRSSLRRRKPEAR